MFLHDLDIMPGDAPVSSPRSTIKPATNTRVLSRIDVSRRTFINGVSAGALVVGVSLAQGCAKEKTAEDTGAEAESQTPADNAEAQESPLVNVKGGDATPSLFIAIEPDGAVKITCHRSEMGQQTWTAMTQIVSDELEADWEKIEVIQAEGHPRYGDQNTDGSRSVRNHFHRLRVAGAAMRLMLERAAAAQWGVDAGECKAALGVVKHAASGKSLGYGDLVAAATEQPIPTEEEVSLKSRDAWRYIGKETPSLTVPKIVRGEGTFGMDVDLPDMVYAVIARPPQLFGAVKSFDDSAARQTPGVLRTVKLPDQKPPAGFGMMGGIAVIAKDTWAAIQGRNFLDIEWADGPNKDYNSAAFAEEMMATARQSGQVRRNRGDVDAGLAGAATRIEAEYYAPHLSQSPMEPPSATAKWTGDKVECWGCIQAPQAARNTVAQALGVPVENVTINVTWLGGGFGRKSKPDFFVEAAMLAREVGKPVKVVWTREDDIQNGFYHAVSAQRLEGGLDENGKCTAFLHRTVFPPITSTFDGQTKTPSDGELGLGASDNPFDVPNLRLESGDAAGHLRIGWLRSVANVYHAFAVHSFAAELAHAAGRDQKDYLLELIGRPRTIDPNSEGATYTNYGNPLEEYPIDTGRLAAVTRRAADMAGWGRDLPKGHGLGIAAHRSFLTYVATVVEIAVSDDGAITIPKVWSAADAGTVVNTRHTTAQVEGGTLYGLSNALYGAITAENGAVVEANFPSWRVMRMNEAPRDMDVAIIESDAPPAGVGEPATPPAAPALTNAIFAATGLRIRRLPILGPDRDRLDLSAQRDA